ncbi:MAG: D-sedoheptulose 7-phosphate isomerase [Saprospiraceae bacterium]|nr:D-sedoheptulose 7-phosphate isomerase [Saprospiraceae bacterium]
MEVNQIINEHIATAERLKTLEPAIEAACKLCTNTILRGGKILLAGNGGSAADAQHIAAEFVGRFVKNRKSYPAIALTTDTSALTAIANDYGFDRVFARQIEGLGYENDVFIAISTSGNSTSIIQAVETARAKGLKIIVLSGRDGGLLRGQGDIDLIVSSDTTARIQEMHILIGHILCEYVDESSF